VPRRDAAARERHAAAGVSLSESARKPAPPPQESGLRLGRDGRFTHEGQPIRHARLRAVLERGVCYEEGEGRFLVRLGPFRARIDVEATPFFVRGFDAREGSVTLSDGSREPLAADTLRSDADGALCCRVKGRFEARFTHAAQAELLSHADWIAGAPVLCLGSGPIPLPARLLG
jgi:hypothetical protein